MTPRLLLWILLPVALVRAPRAAEPEVDPKQLPRVAATAPADALATFRVKPGFRLELVAAEPLVIDPIALSFDEDGRLFVVEMRDYSERRPERLGRIRRLEDTDGDGRFDQSTVFAEGLPWPTAVTCWAGGIFVGSTPDILYFKDTDGDGRADVRETVFTGFAADYAPFATNKLNVQALMNSFNWSLDNRIHGATSYSGGRVKRVDTPFVNAWLRRAGVEPRPVFREQKPLDLRGRDFSFDPRTLEMRAESGGGQHGMSFDNRGRKFVCSNSDHLQLIMYEDRYAARNPYFNMPSPRVSIAADGPAAEVFRISPDEPWRVLRTQWRVAGQVPGPVEGGGRASGYFTGATGVTIYRGDAFGEEFVGDAFIGDAGGNLVHRKKLIPDGLLLRAERPADEQNVEFLASTDNWFRPVQFANAPDGCLYIADMYREVIEHPWSLPESLKKHLDLNSGNDRGRIYRVMAGTFQQRPRPALSKVSSAELVDYLGHPNGWHRDTAARVLCERQDRSIIPSLSEILPTNASPSAVARRHPSWLASPMRMRSLYLLASMNALQPGHVVDALRWCEFDVRGHALQLAEPFLGQPSTALWGQLRALTIPANPDEPALDRSASFQLALTLGRLVHPERLELMREFLSTELTSDIRWQEQSVDETTVLKWRMPGTEDQRNRELEWMIPAVLSSSQESLLSLFERLIRSRLSDISFSLPETRRTLALGKMARYIGARNHSNEVAQALEIMGQLPGNGGPSDDERTPSLPDNVEAWTVIVALDEGLRQAGGALRNFGASQKLQRALSRAADCVAHPSSGPPTGRLLAIRALGASDHSEVRSNLLVVVASSSETPEISRAALTVLAEPENANFGADLLQRWGRLAPSVRDEALRLLLKRPERIRALLAAIPQGTVSVPELSIAQQAQLRSHRDPVIREEAARVLGRAATAARPEVVEMFQSALSLKGDTTAGRKLFQERCATCHRLGGEGHTLGPDLATMRSAGKEKLLTGILDPNLEVAPNFASYSIETKDGESLVGVIGSEAAASVTLRQAGGVETVVLRSNIASMLSQGKSLMPEGLESGLSPQGMADLLEFILTR